MLFVTVAQEKRDFKIFVILMSGRANGFLAFFLCCHARADMEAVWLQSSGVPQLPAHRTVSVMEMVRLM